MKKLIVAPVLVALGLAPLEASAGDYAFVSPHLGWSKPLAFSFQLAGRDLNGTALNGDTLEGRHVAFVRLDDGVVGGRGVALMWLDGTRFAGLNTQGKKIKAKDLVGADLVAELDDGTTLPLFVTAARRHHEKHLRDVVGYEVWFAHAEGWEPLCGYDADDEPTVAIPLPGRWSYEAGVPGGGAHVDDPQAFTFACEGYVLAKCVTAGYKPWARTLSCAPKKGCSFGDLADHHQACTRALRADYFGDGTAHTADGVTINLYDDLGIRYDSEPWPFEAAWDADGAICVASPRGPQYGSLVADLFAPTCGFDGGALLVTEREP